MRFSKMFLAVAPLVALMTFSGVKARSDLTLTGLQDVRAAEQEAYASKGNVVSSDLIEPEGMMMSSPVLTTIVQHHQKYEQDAQGVVRSHTTGKISTACDDNNNCTKEVLTTERTAGVAPARTPIERMP